MDKKTKILMIVGSLSNGGVEKVVYNIATFLDKSKFEIYIYSLSNENDYYSIKLKDNHIKVIHEFDYLLKKTSTNKYILLFNRINGILKKNKDISVVHIHETSIAHIALLAAKINHVPIICTHSHMAYSKDWNPHKFPIKSKISIAISQFLYKTLPNYKIGCSVAACKRLYGDSQNQLFIPNGIDFSIFNRDSYSDREYLKNKYGIPNDKINFIFVGRFTEQKNIIFMLDVYKFLSSVYETNLNIVGYGELENEIHEKIDSLGLSNKVKFFSSDANIPELLKASDYFISPSLYEGLGIVFIEAQLMGLPAFASDQVPKEADIGMCEFFPIDKGERYYANCIIKYINDKTKKDIIDEKSRKYDMKEVIKIYEQIYEGKFHEK